MTTTHQSVSLSPSSVQRHHQHQRQLHSMSQHAVRVARPHLLVSVHTCNAHSKSPTNISTMKGGTILDCLSVYQISAESCPCFAWCFNPLERRGNYSATSSDMKLVHWPLMSRLLHLVQRGGDWAGPQFTQAPTRCTKCNSPPINGQCTNHRIDV